MLRLLANQLQSLLRREIIVKITDSSTIEGFELEILETYRITLTVRSNKAETNTLNGSAWHHLIN
jgi:hypothetical protein